jgi:hypothetical protein
LAWSGDIPRVFLSYRHGEANRGVIQRLMTTLEDALSGGEVKDRAGELFVDSQRLAAGDTWEPLLRAELKSADIYLFVVSIHSAATRSSFMWTEEFPVALERWRDGTSWIIPIIVEDVTTPLDVEEPTLQLTSFHSAPNPKRAFAELADDWYPAVASVVREACVAWQSQRPESWDAERYRRGREQALLQLAETRCVFEKVGPQLGTLRAPEILDALSAVELSLRVRGPNSSASLQRAVRALDRIQAKLPANRSTEFDSLSRLGGRVRFLIGPVATNDVKDRLTLSEPTSFRAHRLGQELQEAIKALSEAASAARGLAERALDAPSEAIALIQDASQQSAAHLSLANMAAQASMVDVDAISKEVSAASEVHKSLRPRAERLGQAALGFVSLIAEPLGTAIAKVGRSLERLARRIGSLVKGQIKNTERPADEGSDRPTVAQGSDQPTVAQGSDLDVDAQGSAALEISQLWARRVQDADLHELHVECWVRNSGSAISAPPWIHVRLSNSSHRTLREFVRTPRNQRVEVGAEVAFKIRVRNPPPGVVFASAALTAEQSEIPRFEKQTLIVDTLADEPLFSEEQSPLVLDKPLDEAAYARYKRWTDTT